MKERPILFKGPMVVAIQSGKKTQTRRIVKEQHLPEKIPALISSVCPYGKVGDILWAREAWVWEGDTGWQDMFPIGSFYYRADFPDGDGPTKWKPSIHMPRRACRLHLEITKVRVERLQDISEEDAKAEGVAKGYVGPIKGKAHYSYRMGFFNIWEDINGVESLDSDPWVWVIEFKLIEMFGY